MILRRWLRSEEKEAGLERELRFHIEERVAGMVRSGVSEEDARRRVRLEFGAAEQIKEECRDVRPARWVETFVQDIRYAWRNLRRNPGFAAVAIATLALGIGGLTAMFSAFDTILIRPLPYAEPDRLVMVWDDLSKTDDRTKSAPAPAEWLEVFETDDPDPLHAYPRAASHTPPASQIQPQLSQSFRLAGTRKTNGA